MAASTFLDVLRKSDNQLDEEFLSGSEDDDHQDGVDDFHHTKMLDAIRSLGGKKKVTQRTEPSQIVSEYNLSQVQKEKVSPWQLLTNLKDSTRAHRQTKNQMQSLSQNAEVMPLPLPKPQQHRIERQVAYGKVEREVSLWEPIVKKNRVAEQLVFPLAQPDLKMQPAKKFVDRFKPKTTLELEVQKLLNGSDHVLHDTAELTPAEEKALQAMSVEEARERHNELKKMRALLSYQERKARRQKKIKSKKYHRILKKERLKNQMKEFEELKDKDPELALQQLQELDKQRILERVTLRHRPTGKWAKQHMLRSKYNQESREALLKQLELSRQLTRKVNVESSEDEEAGGVPVYAGAGAASSELSVFESVFFTSSNPWLKNPHVSIPVGSGGQDGIPDNPVTSDRDLPCDASEENGAQNAEEGGIVESAIEASTGSDGRADGYERDEVDFEADAVADVGNTKQLSGDASEENGARNGEEGGDVESAVEASTSSSGRTDGHQRDEDDFKADAVSGTKRLPKAKASSKTKKLGTSKDTKQKLKKVGNKNLCNAGASEPASQHPINRKNIKKKLEKEGTERSEGKKNPVQKSTQLKSKKKDFKGSAVKKAKQKKFSAVSADTDEPVEPFKEQKMEEVSCNISEEADSSDGECRTVGTVGEPKFMVELVLEESLKRKQTLEDLEEEEHEDNAADEVKVEQKRRRPAERRGPVMKKNKKVKVDPTRSVDGAPIALKSTNRKSIKSKLGKEGTERSEGKKNPAKELTKSKSRKKVCKDSVAKKAKQKTLPAVSADIDELFEAFKEQKMEEVDSDVSEEADASDGEHRTRETEDEPRFIVEPLLEESLTRKQTLEDLEKEEEEHEEVAISEVEVEQKKRRPAERRGRGTKNDKKVEVDPTKFMDVAPKALKSQGLDLQGPGDEVLDDDDEEEEEDQAVTISEAFADDDVVSAFQEEKEAQVKKDTPVGVDNFLPGWGDWAGAGIQPDMRKRRRYFIEPPPGAPRKDHHLGHVIINERKDEKVAAHQVSQLPPSFSKVSQFEAFISHPIGNTWNTETSFRDLTQPRVITRQGAIIEPMVASCTLLKKKLKARNRLPEEEEEETLPKVRGKKKK